VEQSIAIAHFTAKDIGTYPLDNWTASVGAAGDQLGTERADNSGMRYLKLAAGVVLVIGGIIVTFGGAAGVFSYFTTCFGAPAGSFEALYCQHNAIVPVTAAWLIVGVILDVAAVITLRFRTRRWTPARSPQVEEAPLR
jgi:hypothetical protein